MTLEELKNNIRINNISQEMYSLNEGLKSMAYVLFKNYLKWEYFYLDEKGDRLNYIEFNNEEDAYEYLWEKLKLELKYPPSQPPKTVYG